MIKIEVKCLDGYMFWMEDYERKTCPKSERVVEPKTETSFGDVCSITTACVEAAEHTNNCIELEMSV